MNDDPYGHIWLEPEAIRLGLEWLQYLSTVGGTRGQQVHVLIRRILAQPGGVEYLCELYQPTKNTDDAK